MASWADHVYYMYAVRARHRSLVEEEFRRPAIQTRVHYPEPIHLTEPWRGLGYRAGCFPHTEKAALGAISSGVPKRSKPSRKATVSL